MKRIISIFIIIFSLPHITACSTIYSNYREIEQLLVIQTLGLDIEEGSVLVSLAAASDAAGNGPRQMSASGGTIEAAIDRAYDLSYEEEIFFSHVDHLIVGQSAAEEDLLPYLDYVCQSSELRVDIPIYIVRDGTANQAVMGLGNARRGASELMQAVHEAFASPSGSKVFTVADVMSSLEQNGSALVCAVECLPSAEKQGPQTESSPAPSQSSQERPEPGENSDKSQEDSSRELMASPAGYAIIRQGKLCKYIEQEEALALGLMLRSVPITPLVLRDMNGKNCTLEVDSGSTRVEPVWSSSGELKGLNIQAQVHAALQETGILDTGSAQYINQLTARLEAELSRQLSSLLQSSMKLKADFLGLGKLVERSAPDKYRRLSQSFEELLPSLELQLSVSGSISHTNNMREA